MAQKDYYEKEIGTIQYYCTPFKIKLSRYSEREYAIIQVRSNYISMFGYKKTPENLSFTLIRKYLQQLIINADKQGTITIRIVRSRYDSWVLFLLSFFSTALLNNADTAQ